jgi:hypothetical protein
MSAYSNPPWHLTPPAIDAEDDADPVLATFEAEPPAALVPGETIPYEFAFRYRQGDADRTARRDRHARLLSYEELVGNLATGTDARGTPWYREQHGDPDRSLLIAVRPPTHLRDRGVRGVWGLVETVEDATDLTLAAPRARLSVVVLAPLSDYDSARQVRADFEADGI